MQVAVCALSSAATRSSTAATNKVQKVLNSQKRNSAAPKGGNTLKTKPYFASEKQKNPNGERFAGTLLIRYLSLNFYNKILK